MCGIAGIAGKKNQNESRNQVAVMLNDLKHRGPNDEGIEVLDNAVFGHRRLSIFDLSAAGHQPMSSSDENISIVFNGAIYNFLNLRRELEAEGFSFRSQTDTEVLINGYAAWGIDKLVGKIEGMFAFGLWDKRRKTLYLVRYRLGVKPLVYSVKNGELAFASTVRALKSFACASGLGLLKISREVSKSATVLLTGDGGDDVFLGYPEHLHFYLAEKVADKSPAFLLSALQKTVSFLPQNVGVFKRANSFLQYAAGGLGAITRVRDGLPVYQKDNLLGEKMTNFRLPHREISLTSGENLLAEFLKYDRRTRFVGEYLPKVDGATMFHALESRSPFLDTKLWDFAATLPFSMRLQNRELKAILREIVCRRISPELAAAKKQGFGVPVQRWLVGKWKQQFVELMEDSILDQEGWIKSANVLKAIEAAEKENWSPRQLWFIFVLESWFRHERG